MVPDQWANHNMSDPSSGYLLGFSWEDRQSPSGKITKHSRRLKPATKTSLKTVSTEGWCAKFGSCQVFSLAIAKALSSKDAWGICSVKAWQPSGTEGHLCSCIFKSFMLTANNALREQPLPCQLSGIIRVHQKFRDRLYYFIYCRKSNFASYWDSCKRFHSLRWAYRPILHMWNEHNSAKIS